MINNSAALFRFPSDPFRAVADIASPIVAQPIAPAAICRPSVCQPSEVVSWHQTVVGERLVSIYNKTVSGKEICLPSHPLAATKRTTFGAQGKTLQVSACAVKKRLTPTTRAACTRAFRLARGRSSKVSYFRCKDNVATTCKTQQLHLQMFCLRIARIGR